MAVGGGETMQSRMARVETWIEGHEERCEERQAAMGREIRDLKASHADMAKDFKGLTRGAWGLVLALLAWAMAQLYSDMKAAPAAHAAPPAAAAR